MNTQFDPPKAIEMPTEVEANWEKAYSNARKFGESGLYENAVAEARNAWALIPEPRLLSSMSHITLLRLVRLLRKASVIEESVLLSDWIVKESPFREVDIPTFSVQKGIGLFESGRLDEAFEAFNVAWNDSEEFGFNDEDPKYLEFYLSKK